MFTCFTVKAQFTQQWVNSFCCFDTLGPHTFSYPLGRYIQQDTLTLSYFEDNIQLFKKLDLDTGNDIQTSVLSNDTVQSPFYYGGGTTRIANHYITSLIKYDTNSGIIKLYHNSVDENLSTDWTNEITVSNGSISAPQSNLAETDFFTSVVSDSVRVYKFGLNGMFQWMIAKPLLSTNSNDKPSIYRKSLDEIVVYIRNANATLTDFSTRLIKISGSSGAVLKDTIYSHTTGTSHIAFQQGDTLNIAFISSAGHFISSVNIDMITMNEIKNFTSNIACFDELEKFAVDSITDQYYIKSNSSFYGFSSQDSTLFKISLVPEAQGEYDFSDIAFNQQRVFLAYSYFNTTNTPVNNDILVLAIDKFNGTIIGSASYNDSRNTDENYLQHYLDTNAYYVMYANNFDNASILQEETQLGIIKYNFQPQSILDIQSNEHVFFFPNPFQNKVSVHFTIASNPLSYAVYNILGELIKQDYITHSKMLDFETLKHGVYSIIFRFQNSKTTVMRMVKI